MKILTSTGGSGTSSGSKVSVISRRRLEVGPGLGKGKERKITLFYVCCIFNGNIGKMLPSGKSSRDETRSLDLDPVFVDFPQKGQ